MFNGCKEIKYLDLSNFDTSKVELMQSMFNGCESLEYLDISNFQTNSSINFGHMFYNCTSLLSLDLSNFITINNLYMDYMFYGCSNLTSLNLSNFETQNQVNFTNMFNGCTSLKFLDISNFDTSKITGEEKLNDIFSNCPNLEYINLKNYKSGNYYLKSEHFNSTPKNLVICTLNDLLKQEFKNNECIRFNCEENWYDYKTKIYEEDKCIDDCTLTNYPFEFEYKCYSSCFIGTYNNNYKCEKCHPDCGECDEANTTFSTNCETCKLSDKYLYFGNCLEKCPRINSFYINESNNQKICKCDLPQCYTCSNESLEKNLCTKCEEDYYPLYNEFYMINFPLLNCSHSPEGYYLDEIDLFYKLCYPSCKTCEKRGDNETHNCIKCGDNYLYEVKINNYFNCYNSCIFYHYFDEDNNYHCTLNFSCPQKYSKLLIDEMECVKNVEIKKMIENVIITNETKEKTKEEEIEYYDTIMKDIDTAFTSEDFDTSDLDKGNDETIEIEKMKITFTTTKTQNDNENNNMTTIDLGECEILLRNFYNISNNETLYMKKIEKTQEGMKISKIEYVVYAKLTGTKLIQLDLSVCQKSKISLSVPVIVKDSLDKLNSSSDYYNDICYTAKSDYGTDISLKDKKMNMLIKQCAKMIATFRIIIILLKKRNVHVKLKNLLHLLVIWKLIQINY